MQFRYMRIQHRAGTLESHGAAVIPIAPVKVPAMMPPGLLLATGIAVRVGRGCDRENVR